MSAALVWTCVHTRGMSPPIVPPSHTRALMGQSMREGLEVFCSRRDTSFLFPPQTPNQGIGGGCTPSSPDTAHRASPYARTLGRSLHAQPGLAPTEHTRPVPTLAHWICPLH